MPHSLPPPLASSPVHHQPPPLTWERCHPDTRALLIDALVWDLVDEAGPNTTEPGLAALEQLAEAADASTNDAQLLTLHQSMLLPTEPEELSPRTINNDDTTLGLAFAALKLLGSCPQQLLAAAIQAIERQNDPAMLALRAPEDPDRFAAQRNALRTILECAAITGTTDTPQS